MPWCPDGRAGQVGGGWSGRGSPWRLVPGWTKPIIIGRHAHGDQDKATNFPVPGAGLLTLTFPPAGGGAPQVHEVATYGDDGGVAMGDQLPEL